jgi:hypothetical protein
MRQFPLWNAQRSEHYGSSTLATFDWPKDEAAVAQMSLAQLRLLLEGFELRSRRGWRRYDERLQAGKPPPELMVTREL